MKTVQLRQLTQEAHDRLEYQAINKNLFSNPNLENYIDFLQVQYSLCQALEMKIFRFQDRFLENSIDLSSRADDIKKELESLGKTIQPIVADLDVADDFLEALCSLYLLEGSRHGGKMILNHIQSILPNTHKALFLEIDPQVFHQKWQKIIALLESICQNENDMQKVVTTINRLYSSMEGFYNGYTK